MEYRFIYDRDGRRLMVAEMDDELYNINCTDEDLDCLVEYYSDMTVIFDVDRYIRLHSLLHGLDTEDRRSLKVYMDAVIRSQSGSFVHALMGCCLEIYWYGCTDVEAHWFWKGTNIDFNVALIFPPEFYADPAAWFEREITAKGIKNYEESGV